MSQIKISDIKREDRVREDYGDVAKLAESILSLGLIQPICINQDNTLVAGGRRTRALLSLVNSQNFQVTDDCHPDIISFIQSGGILIEGKHFTRMTTRDISHLSMLELEENVRRKQFAWQETCLAVRKVHNTKQGEASRAQEKWWTSHTGELLGMSNGNVGYCLLIAQHIADGDEEVTNAEGLMDALRIITQRKHDLAEDLVAKRTMAQIKAGTSPYAASATNKEATAGVDDVLSSWNEEQGDDALAQPNSLPNNPSSIPVSHMIRHGSFLDLPWSPESVDHIITDPPYGIDMANLDQGNTGMDDISRIAETHDVQSNLDNFNAWLQQCHYILRDKGFCVWFCDAVHWNHLRLLAEDIGFKSQRWPLVWIKAHSCMNQAASYNFTKNIEVALVLRKGVATLTEPQSTCYHMASSDPERRLFSGHPFVKPTSLWQWIAQAVALKNQTICDPFSGVGSMSRALLHDGYNICNCEIDSTHYNQQFNMICEFYREKYGADVTFS